jgi:class 3 adenylate cyclase
MDEKEAFAPIQDLARRFLITGAILLPLLAILSNWIANFFTRPISKLLEGTQRITEGITDIKVDVTSKDEFGELAASFNDMARNLHNKELTIKEQLEENERLLLNVLPPSAVERVKGGERDFADSYVNVSLLYAEIEGFSDLLSEVTPEESVSLLNELIGAFDQSSENFAVEKLKTVGTSYLAACGLTVPRVDYAKRIVDFAVEMIKITQRFNKVHNANLSLDIGIHAGPVTGGIVGKSKFIYELWGDSLKIAYAIHSSPDDDVIQVTEPIRNALENIYVFSDAEDKSVKGMGNIAVWQVNYRGSENVIDVVAR